MTPFTILCCAVFAIVYLILIGITQYVSSDSKANVTHNDLTDDEYMKLQIVYTVKIVAQASIAVGGAALIFANVIDLSDTGKTLRKFTGLVLDSTEANTIVVFATCATILVLYLQWEHIWSLGIRRWHDVMKAHEGAKKI